MPLARCRSMCEPASKAGNSAPSGDISSTLTMPCASKRMVWTRTERRELLILNLSNLLIHCLLQIDLDRQFWKHQAADFHQRRTWVRRGEEIATCTTDFVLVRDVLHVNHQLVDAAQCAAVRFHQIAHLAQHHQRLLISR